MAVNNWTETTAEAIFGNNQFYKWLKTIFALKNHAHTLSSYTLANYDTTNLSTCDVTFYRQLNMVTVMYHINTVQFSNTTDHTVTANEIPTEYRPSDTFYQDIVSYTGAIRHGLLSIGTDGSMKIRMGTSNTSMNVYGSLTYIVED